MKKILYFFAAISIIINYLLQICMYSKNTLHLPPLPPISTLTSSQIRLSIFTILLSVTQNRCEMKHYSVSTINTSHTTADVSMPREWKGICCCSINIMWSYGIINLLFLISFFCLLILVIEKRYSGHSNEGDFEDAAREKQLISFIVSRRVTTVRAFPCVSFAKCTIRVASKISPNEIFPPDNYLIANLRMIYRFYPFMESFNGKRVVIFIRCGLLAWA